MDATGRPLSLMIRSSPRRANATSRLTVLHLVCGIDKRGGSSSYVRKISSQPIAGVEQRTWRHRDYEAENDSYVCQGWARRTDLNVARDVLGAFLDFIPLYLWLRRHPSVILHAHTRMGGVLAVLIRLVRPIPVIAHIHARPQWKGLHRWLWRLGRSKVIFNSKGTRDHFDSTPPDSEVLMPTIPWPNSPMPGHRRCISASLIVPHKNVCLIVQAYNQTPPFPDGTLHVYGFSPEFGDPAYEKQVIALARQNARIHLHDWSPRWTEDLGTTDIFIHGWKMEPFGIVLLEAYAKGCRIVAPHGTFLDDLPSAGVFTADLTIEDLAKKIEMAQAFQPSPDFWEKRAGVAGSFSIENAAKRLAVIYKNAANVDK